MIKPLSPAKASKEKENLFPDKVIEVINRFIAQRYNGNTFTITNKELREEFVKIKGFQSWWLDFEPIYRKEGWDIYYDAPGYNESWYEPFYRFTAKK